MAKRKVDTSRKVLSVKQEKFCKLYIELGNASEAYRRSYDAKRMKPDTVAVKACELLKSGKVAVRIKELQKALQMKHEVTVDSLTQQYDEDRKFAKQLKNPSAMVSATTGKAKLHGLLKDKAEVEHKGLTPTTVHFTIVAGK